MLAPTPLLKPGPLDIGGLFSASITVLKRRFGTFALISLLPLITTMVVFAIAGVVAVMGLGLGAGLDRTGRSEGPGFGLMVAAGALIFVGMLVVALVQLKTYGMLTLAAYEVAQGQSPTVRGLAARTRGFLPRMAPVVAIVAGVAIVCYAVLFGLIIASVNAAGPTGGGDSTRALAAMFGVMALVFLVALPVGFILSVKLLYTVQAATIEQVGGVPALRRSWALTRGAFWRTFGSYIVASLAVGALGYAVSMVTQVALLPATAGLQDVNSEAQAMAVFAALVPAIGLSLLAQFAIQVFAVPFLQSYITFMYIDQVRRSETPAGFGAPGYYAPPGQYYGQPQQGYPPQAQWYPPPQGGQGWTPPQQGGQGWTPPQQGTWYPPQGGQPPQGGPS